MYEIRDARRSDAAMIASVHVKCWSQCYTYLPPGLHKKRNFDFRFAQWDRETQAPKNEKITLVLIDNGEIVGFAHAKPNDDPDIPEARSELHACYFLQRYRRTAAGPMMLSALIRWTLAYQMTPFCIWAWENNPIRLTYATLGFDPVVSRERKIEGFSLPETGYLSQDVEASARRVDRMISHVAFRAGRAQSRPPSRPQRYPTVLRDGTQR